MDLNHRNPKVADLQSAAIATMRLPRKYGGDSTTWTYNRAFTLHLISNQASCQLEYVSIDEEGPDLNRRSDLILLVELAFPALFRRYGRCRPHPLIHLDTFFMIWRREQDLNLRQAFTWHRLSRAAPYSQLGHLSMKFFGAGKGNWTLMTDLEGQCSTIELYPLIWCPRSDSNTLPSV